MSHKTQEAEVIAADFALRTLGLPALTVWNVVLRRQCVIRFMEDNQSTIRIFQVGKNPALRHVGRTHRVDMHWLHKRF